jgi:hypothetical protein
MPTRKQRRRREKSFRHEWEYVEIDPETGEERPVAPAELRPERPERKSASAKKPQQQRGRSTRREPQQPSWRRVWRRTGLFAPLMALFIYWTQSSQKGGVSLLSVVLNTVILIAFFAPFSYLVDTMTYRIWVRRTEQRSKR